VGDGVHDDADAVQAAVDACLRTPLPTPLTVDGVFRLGRTVMIDRPTGKSQPRFNIVGSGVAAAFTVNGDVTMFSTRLPIKNDPLSEGVVFRDILFGADRPDRRAQCFGGGLFRMTFINCEWLLIRCLASPIYAQSWRFSACRAHEWQGIFFQSAGSYDVVLNLECKFGDTVLQSVSNTWPTMRMRVHDCVIEGIRDSAIRVGRAAGLSFDGNYCEFNGGPALDLTAHPDGNTTAIVQANTFVQSDTALASEEFFDIRWGRTRRGFATGNFCNGRLHDTAGMTRTSDLLTIAGDVADVALYRGYTADPAKRKPVGRVALSPEGGGGAAAGGSDLFVGAGPHGVDDGPARRLMFGSVSPQTDNGRYGNVAWSTGSRVFNDAPARGQPKGWICVSGGTPGTWIAEELL